MRHLTLLLVYAPVLLAQDLPRAEPKTVGLDAAKLAKIDTIVNEHIEKKDIAGSVTLVARRGKVVYFKAHGLREVVGEKPMQLDTIFRIYSMSKPITSVAAMILVEQGKLKLDDLVAKHIPAFRGAKVFGAEEPVDPGMTVRDLMRHTSGLTYGYFGNTEVDKLYRSKLPGALSPVTLDLEAFVNKLAELPLVTAPNTRWIYSYSTDVLGRVVEVVSGKKLDVFLREKVFVPLGMKDTGFWVPKEKLDRFSANYTMGMPSDVPARSRYAKPAVMFSGGGGLVSTAADYARFCLMLRGHGKALLKPETIALMTRNHVRKELLPISIGPMKMPGTGFGYGVSVNLENGEYGWAGAASTTFFVHPLQDIVFINMIQRMPFWGTLRGRLAPVVYRALIPS